MTGRILISSDTVTERIDSAPPLGTWYARA